MPSAKKLGFAVGDLVWTGAFPGVIVGDIGTTTPTCEVWGFEQEQGSVYATDLKHMEPAIWKVRAEQHGHKEPFMPWNKKAAAGLEAAGLKVTKR